MTNTLSFVESIIGFGLMHYALSEVGNTGKIRISLCLAFLGFLVSWFLVFTTFTVKKIVSLRGNYCV